MRSINDIQALSQFLAGTCRLAGVFEDAGRPVFADIEGRYSRPDRFYHTLAHVAAMLRTVSVLQRHEAAVDPAAVQFAVWFHDATYDARAADNEEKSAEYAAVTLDALGVPEHRSRTVQRLILATKMHQAEMEDKDCQTLLDADLAVLGASFAEYEAYTQAVRREYAWVSEPAWRAGRARVLESFLRRPGIYYTPTMRDAREDAAQQNLRRELEALT